MRKLCLNGSPLCYSFMLAKRSCYPPVFILLRSIMLSIVSKHQQNDKYDITKFHLPLSSQIKSEGRAACSREIIIGVSHTLLVPATLLVVSVSAIATCRLLIKAYFNIKYSGIRLKAFTSPLCSNYSRHNFRKPNGGEPF